MDLFIGLTPQYLPYVCFSRSSWLAFPSVLLYDLGNFYTDEFVFENTVISLCFPLLFTQTMKAITKTQTLECAIRLQHVSKVFKTNFICCSSRNVNFGQVSLILSLHFCANMKLNGIFAHN